LRVAAAHAAFAPTAPSSQAAQDLLVQNGFADQRLEHVAARAVFGKATIYRRWKSREALVLRLQMDLAAPHLTIDETGNTRAELLAAVTTAMRAVVDTPFGPVIRAVLSEMAIDPRPGDPLRATSPRSAAPKSQGHPARYRAGRPASRRRCRRGH
jgi:AcrR family transcriptional regulator